jgi:hypothetical protein
MICLAGGPSHMDMYDLKPDAPADFRGDFRPIKTNVPGFDLCEHMPMQARIADKLALVRTVQFVESMQHELEEVYTGFPKFAKRPSFGSVVSRFRGSDGKLPSYVDLFDLATSAVNSGRSRPTCQRKGLTLDDSLELYDDGRSAWTGENAERGNLARFRELARIGGIARGSVLGIENLDRFCRQLPRRSFALLCELIERGIELHSLHPEEEFTPENLDSIDKLFSFFIQTHGVCVP